MCHGTAPNELWRQCLRGPPAAACTSAQKHRKKRIKEDLVVRAIVKADKHKIFVEDLSLDSTNATTSSWHGQKCAQAAGSAELHVQLSTIEEASAVKNVDLEPDTDGYCMNTSNCSAKPNWLLLDMWSRPRAWLGMNFRYPGSPSR